MSSLGAAPRAAVPASSARAEASRRNGARSRGPRTPEGKARSAQNALKHGLRAQRFVVLAVEDAAGFQALEAALIEELAPAGALQSVLAQRVAVAAWRLARADRIEAEMLANQRGEPDLGLVLIRDGHGARAFPTLLRYRGTALAEFMRCLRALKALQAEEAAAIELSAGRHAQPERTAPTSPARSSGRPTPDRPAPRRSPSEARPNRNPNEPEPPANSTRPEGVESCPSPRLPGVLTNPTPVGIGGEPHGAWRTGSPTASRPAAASPG
jgi:hypothetical protein